MIAWLTLTKNKKFLTIYKSATDRTEVKTVVVDGKRGAAKWCNENSVTAYNF